MNKPNGTHVLIEIGMPAPNHDIPAAAQPLPIEDQVRDALECIQSGYRSDIEWTMINKLYKELRQRRPTPRIRNLMQMIEPVLAKFGYHKTTTEG